MTNIQRLSIIKKRHSKRRKLLDAKNGESSKDIIEESNADIAEPLTAEQQRQLDLDTIEIERAALKEFTTAVQKQYSDNIKKLKDDTSDEARYVKVALIEAEEVWLNSQILIRSPMYKKMSDDQKISLVQKDFALFYKNFPIVARYMICHGQYSSEAFRKMLINCKNSNLEEVYELVDEMIQNETPQDKKGKGKMPESIALEQKLKESEKRTKANEILWVKRQADYVRYLWEYMQDNKFLQVDSDNIWKQAYQSLYNEFMQFKEMHKNTESKIKEEQLKHKKELLYEMSTRIIEGSQSLPKDAAIELLNKLKDKVYKQRYTKLLNQLLEKIPEIEPVTFGQGTNEQAQVEYEEELQQSYYKKNYQKMDFSKLQI